jgi:hypothetical protein
MQSLEPRRLFSSSFFPSFNGGGFFEPNPLALPLENLSLPQPASALPEQNLALPHESLALPVPTVSSNFNIRGFYVGKATIEGLGTTPLALSITRQHRGSISGTLTLPAFGRSVSGTVPLAFMGNRRFSATLIQNGNSAQVTARRNRDNTLTGQFSATTSAQHFSGSFSLTRVST